MCARENVPVHTRKYRGCVENTGGFIKETCVHAKMVPCTRETQGFAKETSVHAKCSRAREKHRGFTKETYVHAKMYPCTRETHGILLRKCAFKRIVSVHGKNAGILFEKNAFL